jgi:putative acetyltransferase
MSVEPAPRLRSVEQADVPAVAELVREVLAEFGLVFGVGSDTDEDVFRLPGSYTDGGGLFWVAEDRSGQLLGTCGIYPIEPRVYELRKMYVHPHARGRGVGRLLLEEAVAAGRARHADRIVLDTHERMLAAVKLYERVGFVRDDGQIRGERCTRGYRLDL